MKMLHGLILFSLVVILSGCSGEDDIGDTLTTKDVALRISLLPIFDEYTERKTESDVSSQVILVLKKGKERFKINVSKLSILGETSTQAYSRTINAKPAFSTLVVEDRDIGLGDKSVITSMFGGSYKKGDRKTPKYYLINVFQEPFDIEIFRSDHRQVASDARLARYKSNAALMREVARQMDGLGFLKVNKTDQGPDPVPSIMKTPEVEAFCGKHDDRISKNYWPLTIEKYARETLKIAKKKTDVTKLEYVGHPLNPITIWKSTIFSGNELFKLTALNTVPSEVRDSYVLAAASAGAETALAAKILQASKESLLPADVMSLALDASEGNYALAVAAANGVLKEATMLARREIVSTLNSAKNYKGVLLEDPGKRQTVTKIYGKQMQGAQEKIAHHNRIVSRLKGLRPTETKICDKMGIWYHIFTILTIGAIGNADQAEIAQNMEHLAKQVKFFSNEGGFNEEKSFVDGKFSEIVAAGMQEHFRKSLSK